jgi:hypothetical protein
MVRMHEREMQMLEAVSDREQMGKSEMVRWLIRREFEREKPTRGVLSEDSRGKARRPRGERR